MRIGKSKAVSDASAKKDEKTHVKKHVANIYAPDVSSISIAFKDAKQYTPDEIINAMKAAERIDKLMKKQASGKKFGRRRKDSENKN